MKKIVLNSVIVDHPDIEEEIISKNDNIELCFIPISDKERFKKEIKTADGIVVADTPITSEMIDTMEKCKVIVRQGIGFDSIALDAAKRKDIIVCNVPDYSIEEVSEFTVALILLLNRHILDYNAHTHVGVWDVQSIHGVTGYPPIRRATEQTVGIIGMGRIAKLVAKKLKPFGFKLQSYDPFVDQSQVDELDVKMVDLDTLLETSDFVTLNLPLNDATYHMMNNETFKKMKSTAYFVNTGRGPLVEEEALYKALKEGVIAGAAIDVTETEPLPKNHKLFTLDNLIITPHAAFFSKDSFIELRERAITEAIDVINGLEPKNQVN